MVILDVDHPDIEEFIWCKANEERKARVLRDAGFDMDLDGADSFSIQYQNANNSVRVTDEFMQAVVDDADWDLHAVTTGEVVRDRPRPRPVAPDRPGRVGVRRPRPAVRHHDQPLAHRRTPPVASTARNPCSEYMHLDNSACNLASINLLHVPRRGRHVRRRRASRTPSRSCSPPRRSSSAGPTTRPRRSPRPAATFRQLGLGYANLGALLMALGLPYDSRRGPGLGGGAHVADDRPRLRHQRPHRQPAWARSPASPTNEEHMLRRAAHAPRRQLPDRRRRRSCRPSCSPPASEAWDSRVRDGEEYGVRNSQAIGARADRHDRPDDGLRHHRHRARPRRWSR